MFNNKGNFKISLIVINKQPFFKEFMNLIYFAFFIKNKEKGETIPWIWQKHPATVFGRQPTCQ